MAPSGPPARGSTIVYTAIGASDANGVGSSVPCLPLDDCANGMGYVVTIFAGVQEVNVITAALGAGAGGSDPNGYIDNQVKAFGADYAVLLRGITGLAGSSRIVVLNIGALTHGSSLMAPYLSYLPYLPYLPYQP